MRWVAWVWLGLLGLSVQLGCGDDCVQAVSKLADECDLGHGDAIDSEIRQCDAKTLCRAHCVLNYDCSQITAKQNDNPYDKCLADCEKK